MKVASAVSMALVVTAACSPPVHGRVAVVHGSLPDRSPESEAVDAEKQQAAWPPWQSMTVIILYAKYENQPVILWTSPYQDGVWLRDEHARLVMGEAPLYIANDVKVRLLVHPNGDWCSFFVDARDPIVDRPWFGSVRWKLRVPLQTAGGTTASPPSLALGQVETEVYYGRAEHTPPGFDEETRPRWQWVKLGTLFFASAYVVSVSIAAATGFEAHSELYAIPVAGPLMFYEETSDNFQGVGMGTPYIMLATLGVSLAEAFGLSTIVLGLINQESRIAKEGTTLDASMVPMISPDAQGLWLRAAF